MKDLPRLAIFVSVLSVVFTPSLKAQIFTELHDFISSDGTTPTDGLVLSGSTLYGTADEGGSAGSGTVFAINTNGTGFINLHNFTALLNGTNGDGANPHAALVLSGNTLYGTTINGGNWGNGTIFALNTNGSGLRILHTFSIFPSLPLLTNIDGAQPYAGLVTSGNTLYGTTFQGGLYGHGTVFAVGTNGTGFTVLHSFSLPGNWGTNSDGTAAFAGLVLSGETLYGTTHAGGLYGRGTAFAIGTNGTGFTTLHHFGASTFNSPGVFTNSDGANPGAALVLSGNTLYGTTTQGGTTGDGTVFAVNTNGTGFTTLCSLTSMEGQDLSPGLVLSGSTLYGMAEGSGYNNGAGSDDGMVFSVDTNGQNYTVLHKFGSDGAFPLGGLTVSGNSYYGTTSASQMGGIVFRLTVIPPGDYPKITSQKPETDYLETVNGATETMTVAASGAPPLQFQWFGSFGPIMGATNSSLTLSNITDALNGDSYWVIVSNGVGSATSQKVQLHVVLAARRLPGLSGQNLVGYWPNVPTTNVIKVGPPQGTASYTVQDQAYVTNGYATIYGTNLATFSYQVADISDGGNFDSVHGIIKWRFLSGEPHTLTYAIVPSANSTNWVFFNGSVSIAGTNYSINGDIGYNLLPLHPADNDPPLAGRINTQDMSDYAQAWLDGQNWPVEPSLYANGGIPDSYVSRAIYLWQHGESYFFDPTVLIGPPDCWVPSVSFNGPSQTWAPATNTSSSAVASMPNVLDTNTPLLVSLTVTPDPSVKVYAVEDGVPIGWTVTNILINGTTSSDQTAFDSYNSEVKWGPFSDSNPRMLSYEVFLPANVSGLFSFVGTVAFGDGMSIPITGVRQISSNTGLRPNLQSVSLLGANLQFNGINAQVGTTNYLLMGTNLLVPLNQWIPVGTNIPATSGSFTLILTNAVDPSIPRRFFILATH